MQAALSISNLGMAFENKVLFSGLCADLQPGQNAIIAGESGSGKSTLLHCIMGFAIPDEGEIRIEGVRLGPDTVWSARTRMAMVQQEPEPGQGRVGHLIRRPFEYRANAGLEFDEKLLDELMERFRMSRDLLEKQFADLSGGEKQRAALISALLLRRPILLLDEVSSALDEESTRAVIDYLKTLTDTTIITVAHDRAMHAIADTTITLNGDSK
jgi:ABC-type multidrug transport system ATPase subunit